jgi:hypothetical protein
MYVIANPADTYLNSTISVTDRLCSVVKNRGHTINMDRWFSNSKLSDHLWACDKKTDTVMPKRKEMPKQVFPKKLKLEEKTVAYRDLLMATRWRDVQHV